MNIKQKLLGGLIGKVALSLRDRVSILSTAYFEIEKIGTLANDRLATRLVTQICKSEKIFIDIGSHIGSIISEVAYYNPSVEIIGIEAIPEKVINLRKKFLFAKFYNCAVGESTGETTFFVNTRQSGYSSLGKPVNINQELISEIKIPLRKLDELIDSNNVDVIKIDVEGADLGVLLGGLNILNNNRPIVMFESAPQKNDDLGYTKKALYQLFVSNNYVILIPNRVAHEDSGLTEVGFIESHLYPRRTTNYFAIPQERHLEIREKARKILKIES